MLNNFVIAFPDPETDIHMKVIFPIKEGVYVLPCRTKPKFIIDCIFISEPIYFRDKEIEFLYNRNDAYFIHKN